MFAATRTSVVWPEKVDDVLRLYASWVAGSDVAGAQLMLALADRDIGSGLALGVYPTEDDLAQGGDLADVLLRRAGSMFAVAPIRETYEVFINAVPVPPTLVTSEAPLFARVTTLRMIPAAIDEAFGIVQQNVLKVSQQQRGHRGFIGLGNRETGKTASVVLWESESALHASEHSGNYQNQLARIARFLREPPAREVYEVIALRVADAST